MKCSRPRCDREVSAVRLCGTHYMKALRAGGLLGTGKRARVDSTELVQHIKNLRALGWTWPMIADAAGVSVSVVHGYHTRPNRPATRATAEAVLSVPLKQAYPHNKLVDPTGTRRRLEALELLGWPRMVVEQKIGVAHLSISQAMSRGKVTARMAHLVEAFYLGHNDTPGPSDLVAKRARSRGLHPASAWEDDVIDDPHAEPNYGGFDELIVQALVRGDWIRSSPEDRTEAAMRLAERGMDEYEIARVLRSTPDRVRERLAGAA